MASIEKIIDGLVPSVRNAFIQSIREIVDEANLALVVRLIEAGQIEQALNALNIRPEFFAPLDEALRSAYTAGGAEAMSGVTRLRLVDPNTGGRVVARFDARNPRAEEFLGRQSSRLIKGDLSDDIRRQVREVLEAGLQAGRAPRSVALDLIGRKPKTGGPRKGGIIGMSDQHRKFADDAFEELISSSPTMKRNYLKRKTRNKRFDALVRKAIEEGRPIPKAQARAMIDDMRDRLLRVRGEAIARTELLESVNHSQDEGLRQMLDSGRLKPEQITCEWDAASDKDTRPSHAHMDGQKRPFGEPFLSGNGHLLMYPGDRSRKAPASEIVHCRCVRRIRINHVMGLR